MDNQLRFFQFVQKYYQTMGICPIQSSANHLSQSIPKFSINTKSLFFLLSMSLLTLSMMCFLLFDVTNMQDFGTSFYAFFCGLKLLMDYLNTVWQMPNIMRLIKLSERFIAKSRCY